MSHVLLQFSSNIIAIELHFKDHTWREAASALNPSVFMRELLVKFNSFYSQLVKESVPAATMVASSVYEFICSKFMEFLNGSDVVSNNCLHQMQRDLEEYKQFVAIYPSIVLNSNSELSQILKLGLLSDWDVYVEEFGKNGSYNLVKISTALLLLEKTIKYEEEHSRVLRSRKRQHQNHLKKLRHL